MKSLTKHYSPRHWIAYLVASFYAILLTACGGGGGSAGTVTNQPTPTPTSTVSSLVITTSASTISSSGAPGTEVTVTVLARDSRNVAVTGATISLIADSGAIVFDTPTGGGTTTTTPGMTDATGTVTAKLSIAGVSTLRTISIVASAGSVRSETKQVTVVAPSSTLSMGFSSVTLQSSGEVLVTVLAKDGANNVIKDAVVNITSSSGALIIADNKTNSDGKVMARLTAGNDFSERTITVTASLNASPSIKATGSIDVKTAVPKLTISSSSGNLDSAGATGTEVSIVVLVRDASNNVMKNATVGLSADSGSLTVGNRSTNDLGIVTEKLSTGNDPTARIIKVTATSPGVAPQSVNVTVSGTQVKLNASSSVNSGSPTDMTVTVTDSSGKPIANQAVTFSTANGGLLVVKGGGTPATNGGGQLVLTFTGKTGTTSDTVTVTALNVSTTATILVNNSNFTVTPEIAIVSPNEIAQGNINTCYKVNIRNEGSGGVQPTTVNLGVSRGNVFSNSNCTTALTAALPLVAGSASAYVSAPSPGVAALVATLNTGVSTRGSIEFVAPLLATANVVLQVDPAVIGINTVDTNQRAVVRAIVRDGSAANNLVKNAEINFSIVADASGGVLLQPSVVKTGADGVATVSFVSGPTATATDGVVLQGRLNSTLTSALGQVRLTVGRQALFITAGTGNTIIVPPTNVQAYIQNYQVLVTDAAGNPVSGANVTASVLPYGYYKGQLTFQNLVWTRPSSAVFCANEDLNQNGILDAGEDRNHNSRLEPGIPLTVTAGGQTDATGATTVAIQYAKDQSNWLLVDLTIRATVAGTEAKYVARFPLVGLLTDYNSVDKSPPGQLSPYGIRVTANANGDLPCETTD